MVMREASLVVYFPFACVSKLCNLGAKIKTFSLSLFEVVGQREKREENTRMM